MLPKTETKFSHEGAMSDECKMQSAKCKKSKLRDINHGQRPYDNFAICILKFDLCIAFFVPSRLRGIFGSGLHGLGFHSRKFSELFKRLFQFLSDIFQIKLNKRGRVLKNGTVPRSSL
jgi:hypothetical protein